MEKERKMKIDSAEEMEFISDVIKAMIEDAPSINNEMAEKIRKANERLAKEIEEFQKEFEEYKKERHD